MQELFKPLNDAQAELLRVIAGPMIYHGRWPIRRYIEMEMHHLGFDADEVMASMPVVGSTQVGNASYSAIWYDHRSTLPDSVVRLTVAAALHNSDYKPVGESIITALTILVEKVQNHRISPFEVKDAAITSSELASTNPHLTRKFLDAFPDFLRYEPFGLTGNVMSDEDNLGWTMTLMPRLLKYSDINSVPQYVERVTELVRVANRAEPVPSSTISAVMADLSVARSTLTAMADDEAKHVFVSYVREDTERVDKLCEALEAANIPYWRDRTALAPGDQWKQKISRAIRSGSLIFLACFSDRTQAKAKSYMNEELTLAAEEFRQYPPGATWLIPVRFAEIDIPAWDLGAGRMLSDLNYADLFGDKHMSSLINLITTINKVMGATGPDAATVRASIEEADDAERPDMLRRMVKEMIVDPARRIELDDLISQETQRILAAMRNEEQFPTQRLDGTDEDRVVRCAEVAAAYWQLAEPFCASLQVATRWAKEPRELAPWTSALKAIASEAMKPRGGNIALLHLRHVPAVTATFAAALAATGQERWDNLKALLVDTTVPQRNGDGRDPLMHAENPWTMFDNWRDVLPSVVARAAATGEDHRTVLEMITTRKMSISLTPVAEWFHSILKPHFADQYPGDTAYDHAFDRTEILLGILSQDVVNARSASNPENSWKGRPMWFGRSTWRVRYEPGTIADIEAEIATQGPSWGPLEAGLFGGELHRATTAASDYAEHFNRMAQASW